MVWFCTEVCDVTGEIHGFSPLRSKGRVWAGCGRALKDDGGLLYGEVHFHGLGFAGLQGNGVFGDVGGFEGNEVVPGIRR